MRPGEGPEGYVYVLAARSARPKTPPGSNTKNDNSKKKAKNACGHCLYRRGERVPAPQSRLGEQVGQSRREDAAASCQNRGAWRQRRRVKGGDAKSWTATGVGDGVLRVAGPGSGRQPDRAGAPWRSARESAIPATSPRAPGRGKRETRGCHLATSLLRCHVRLYALARSPVGVQPPPGGADGTCTRGLCVAPASAAPSFASSRVKALMRPSTAGGSAQLVSALCSQLAIPGALAQAGALLKTDSRSASLLAREAAYTSCKRRNSSWKFFPLASSHHRVLPAADHVSGKLGSLQRMGVYFPWRCGGMPGDSRCTNRRL